MSTRHLLSPVRIGRYELRNRVVMAPLTRQRADAERVPSPLAATYYAQRASAGLIVTEATHATPGGAGYWGTPGLHTPPQIDAWRRVTSAVHERGGRIFVQLWHTGRVAHPDNLGGLAPVAPSPIGLEGTMRTAAGPQPYPTPRPLAVDEIPAIVRTFADGARHALEAGFDGVEVHGANGYLLDQFLRDGTNHRTDDYGGPVANRARLLLEVTEAVTDAIGADRVGVRLSPVNRSNRMHDSDPHATFAYAAHALRPFGLAYLHVLEQVERTPEAVVISDDTVTAAIRDAYRGGTLMVNSDYTPESADRLIRDGHADLVSFGRPYIANPDLVERIAEGVPLAVPDRATFYTGGEKGYADYPDRTGEPAAAAA
ncbi:MAG: alkene reductase [Gemmatirosa sp.]|nr:alkene reductase [Gemmatirosa sp.]